ncbi:MAG: glycoside hydrolase family 2 protein [Lachnospiraceae bacterium]|nr:glycoside hydrolase family 2 protein [Lachnospiraceae bacterium]
MIFQTLNGNWVMNEKGSEAYIDAKIPGSVLSTLLVQHRIQDPFFGTNEDEVKEIFRNDYYFTRQFEPSADLLQQQKIELVCKGIDTLSKIYINNVPVGTTDNMHRTFTFDIKNYLVYGVNTITIEIQSPINYIENQRGSVNKEAYYVPEGSMRGNQYLRKAHSMFGWNFGPKLPDMGIWRSIDLVGYSLIKLDDVLVVQHHEKKKVNLEIQVKANIIERGMYIIQGEIVTPEGRVSAITETMEGNEATLMMEIEEPRLWWPNGFGEHPLYTVSVYALDMNGNEWDSKSYKIGLRTMSISQERDEFGHEFCFRVNGHKFFAMGANYIPEDSIYSFITKEKINYLLRAAIKSNFNTIRVWGGGYYPSDTFYEMCDEYGIIVWQDFMFAANAYELTDQFARNVQEEVIDNVKRLRHHACLGLFCGNNGIERSWVDNAEFRQNADALRIDTVRLFEQLIKQVCMEYAPQTFYWPSSPSSGGNFDNPNDESRGDNHYWEVWNENRYFSDYKNHLMRFCSEFGFQSFPSLKTVKTFTKEEDRNIFSEVMEHHQKTADANARLISYISKYFLFPKDMESLMYLTQILQAISVKYGVEHFRRNRGACMGTLYWTMNDCWPSVSWSSIDYFGRWKALQYMAKNFYSPIAGSIDLEGNVASVYVQNETRDIEPRRVRISLQTFDFRLLHEAEYQVEIMPGGVELVCTIDYSEFIRGIENRVFMEATFYDEEDNVVSTEIEVFVPYKRLALENSSISYSVIELPDEYVIRMMSGGFAAFVELDLRQADAVFSENYFHLTSKREKAVKLKKSDIRYLNAGTPEIQNGFELEQQLVIRTLRDTY